MSRWTRWTRTVAYGHNAVVGVDDAAGKLPRLRAREVSVAGELV